MKMVRSVILCLLKRLLLLVLLLFFWNYISNMTDYVTNSNKESLYISPMESGKNVGASTSRKRNHCLSSHDFCVGKENANLIINRIFWSDFCESYVPKGKTCICLNACLKSKNAPCFCYKKKKYRSAPLCFCSNAQNDTKISKTLTEYS